VHVPTKELLRDEGSITDTRPGPHMCMQAKTPFTYYDACFQPGRPDSNPYYDTDPYTGTYSYQMGLLITNAGATSVGQLRVTIQEAHRKPSGRGKAVGMIVGILLACGVVASLAWFLVLRAASNRVRTCVSVMLELLAPPSYHPPHWLHPEPSTGVHHAAIHWDSCTRVGHASLR
jgi:hypothetical protein